MHAVQSQHETAIMHFASFLILWRRHITYAHNDKLQVVYLARISACLQPTLTTRVVCVSPGIVLIARDYFTAIDSWTWYRHQPRG